MADPSPIPETGKASVSNLPLVDQLAHHVFSLNPKLNVIPDETSKIYSTWFLTPKRHLLEFVLYCFVDLPTVAGLILYGLSGWDDSSHEYPEPNNVDVVAKVAALGALLTTVYFKYSRGRMLYLFQPCHVTTALLVWCTWFPETVAAGYLFNFYLHVQWGSWVGCLAADLRDYHNPVEIASFFVQHTLLMAMPLYHIARKTYPLYPPAVWPMFAAFHTYHFMLCCPVSIVSGWHIQYQCQPPKQLMGFGQHYRLVMFVVSLLLTYLFRVVLVESWVGVCDKFYL